MRTVGTLPIGLTDMNWGKFTKLNFLSATIWALLLVGGGYYFGETIDSFGPEKFTYTSVLLLCIFLIYMYIIWKKIATKSKI